MERRKVICVVGPTACGKTTLGISLAKRFGKKFIDLDDFIEKKLGMKISEVFASFGEDFFRKEEKAGAEWVTRLRSVMDRIR